MIMDEFLGHKYPSHVPFLSKLEGWGPGTHILTMKSVRKLMGPAR